MIPELQVEIVEATEGDEGAAVGTVGAAGEEAMETTLVLISGMEAEEEGEIRATRIVAENPRIVNPRDLVRRRIHVEAPDHLDLDLRNLHRPPEDGRGRHQTLLRGGEIITLAHPCNADAVQVHHVVVVGAVAHPILDLALLHVHGRSHAHALLRVREIENDSVLRIVNLAVSAAGALAEARLPASGKWTSIPLCHPSLR